MNEYTTPPRKDVQSLWIEPRSSVVLALIITVILGTIKGVSPSTLEAAQPQSEAGDAQSPDNTLQQLAKSKNLKLGKTVDLIPMFDPARHTKGGTWKVEDGVIISGTARYNSLVLPFRLPENYVMHLRLKVLHGRTGINVRGRLQESFFQLVLNGWDNTASGLQLLDNLEPSNPKNETYHPGRVIGSEKRSDVFLLCHKNSVQVTVDGKTIVDWQGDPSRLRLRDPVAAEEREKFYLMTVLTSWEFSKLEIAPILDDPRVAVPTDDEIEKAEKELEQNHKIDFRVVRRDEKLPFAQKLRALIVAETEPVHRYVLYSHALTNASEAGDLKVSMEIADGFAEEFKVSSRKLKQQAILEVARVYRDPLGYYQLALVSSDLAWEAVDEHQYAEAVELLESAGNLARKSSVRPMISQIASLSKQFESWQQAYNAVKDSHEAVQQEGTGPSDHTAWGKFLCLTRGDWEAGLPHLEQGDDRELAKLAAEELEHPRSFQPVTQLVQQWLALAEQYSGSERESIETHARRLSVNAIPLAEDNQLQFINQYGRELFDGSNLYDTKPYPEGVLIGAANANPPAEATIEFWMRTTDTRGACLLKREEEPFDSIGIYVGRGFAVLHANGSFYRKDAGSKAYVSDGQWHHLAVSKVGDHLRLFVDGVPVAELTPRKGFPRPNDSQWRLGNHKWIRGFQLSAQFARIRFSGVSRYHTRFIPARDYKADRATMFMVE